MKLRGLIVGEVRSIETTGQGARGPALDPAMVPQIPADVSARLLPKTLFGERYVDLVTPEETRAGRSGPATSSQDRTTVAIELERVFEDLLPLLRTVRPEKLAATLNALATTLDGRGTRLGKNLVLADAYFASSTPDADHPGRHLRPRRPASTYAVAAPELVRAAKALITTNTTIVQKQDSLKGFFAGTAGFANTTADFLDGTGDRIIQAGWPAEPGVVRQVLPAVPLHGHGPDELGEEHRRCLEERHVPHHPRDHAAAAGLPAGRGACLGREARPQLLRPARQLRQPANPRPGITFADGTNPRAAARPAAPCRRPSRPAAASRSPTPARGWPAPPKSSRSSPPCSRGTAPGALGHHHPARRADAARIGGEPAMKTTSSLAKLIAFAVATLLATGTLAATIANVQFGDKATYKAVFEDVTGVAAGQEVRIAGVRGEIEKVSVHPDRSNALVEFTVAKTSVLTQGTVATVKYRNLVGERYLALTQVSATRRRSRTARRSASNAPSLRSTSRCCSTACRCSPPCRRRTSTSSRRRSSPCCRGRVATSTPCWPRPPR